MGQDIVLECEKYFQASIRPKVVNTSSLSSGKVQERDRKGQPTDRYHYLKRLDGDLRELSRSYSSSLHYESMHSKTLRANGDNEVLKRGSVYQSSKEVRRMRKLQEGRRKVESEGRDVDFISFEIVDHLLRHGTNKANQPPHQNILPLVSLSANSKPAANTINSITTSSTEFLDLSFRDLPDKPLSTNNSCSGFVPAKSSLVDDHSEICMDTVDVRTHCTKAAPQLLESGSLKEHKADCHQMIGPESYGNVICKRDSLKSLPKCFSDNAKMFHTVSQLEYGLAEERGPKTIFSPLKRMFDPIMKSKSVRNSPLKGTQSSGSTLIDTPNIRSNEAFQNSLVNEFPKMEQNIEHDACLVGGELLNATMSPAHLHGSLRLETENGNPSFEFSLEDPQDVLSAKTWRTDNAFNWVYTFHRSKKKIYTGRGTKDRHGQSPSLVGQMQVSCYLCSEVRENGSLDNSTVTEFVLYDIARARRSFGVEQRSKCSSDSIQPVTSNVMKGLVTGPLERNNSVEHPDSARHGFSSCDSNASTSYPWLPEDLHPQLEIAATVIQIPFNKKESLKDTKEFSLNENESLSRFPTVGAGRGTENSLNNAIVKVVTANGTHGSPNADGGPSSLLDRWRFGGGCDCGGWDMACPIAVFNNPLADNSIDHSTWENQMPVLLFVQGSKETAPALSLMAEGNGQYAVNFHAQLSSLQAFSICIAVLHSSEVSSSVIQEKSRQRLYSNSLKLLLEEEVRHLIEEVATEEQRKLEKGVEQMPPFSIGTPFSPMGRV